MGTRSQGLRYGAAVLLTVALGACTTSQRQAARVSASGPVFAALEDAPRRVPLVSLPDAGRPVLVDEVRFQGGLRQQINFGRDGRSRADLTLGRAGTRGVPALERPTKQGIAAELAGLRDGPYRVSSQPARNAYGPMGVAFSERCAFAWQWIDDVRGLDAGSAMPIPGPVSASLRVHHCDVRQRAAEALIADLARLRLGPVVPDRPIRPKHRPRAQAVAETPRQPAIEAVPAADPVPAPRPRVTVNGSRTLVDLPQDANPAPFAAQPPSPRQPPSPSVAVPRPGSAGAETLATPRYLTDSTQIRPSATPEIAPPRPPARQEALSPDIPPQAYRGPTPPPFGW